MAGKCQSPAADPSLKPQEGAARLAADEIAASHFCASKQLAFFSQRRLLLVSSMVPSFKSTKRSSDQAGLQNSSVENSTISISLNCRIPKLLEECVIP